VHLSDGATAGGAKGSGIAELAGLERIAEPTGLALAFISSPGRNLLVALPLLAKRPRASRR